MRRPLWTWLGSALLVLAVAVSGCTGTEGAAGLDEQRGGSGARVEDTGPGVEGADRDPMGNGSGTVDDPATE